MKVYNTSLIKKGILLSLVLLSPEILAAENLNFNYTRADASSLDPRLSKLAQACHTLTDTMDINVLFGEIMDTRNLRVTMTVYGKNAGKGYSAVYSLPGTSGKSATDPDLVVPWSLTFKGAASLTVEQISTTPVMETVYDDPFCFSLKTPQGNSIYANSNKMPPIYSQPPYAKGYSNKDFKKYCWDFNRVNPDNREDTYWPNYDERPDVIAKGMAKSWGEYQGKYMFYRHKYSTDSGATEQHSNWSNIEQSVDAAGGSSAVPGVVNEFPIYQKGAANSVLRNGKFLIKLNNRNVTELKLDIENTYLGAHSIFTWKRDGGYLSNVLAFQGVQEAFEILSAGDIQNDPYQSFYNDGGKGKKAYFRGTLAEAGSLNQKYKDYIKNIMPLSLPPAYRGDINLVNTHSLTFKIGSVNTTGTTVTVYGQPLKFGPLYSADKEAVDAMQVRNACY
ncbi:hypothetical protein YS65_000735 [Salmonella enterica subsp. enterica]|uniref:hypothetical protein n=1 Tax=Salmonella enterica TaxID=28901 RepID=UPI001078E3C5|nr:hypothetical protein [Salmonella enterica]EBS2904741.1 hypothetical protein [Salmonella enterica subsp. enterica serovar Flottbek]EDP8831450.1 hypothetical protein [Salmonella enterica subsp. enterica]EEE4101165.1 hypothetical protein [Salmonella enterica subsp. enterica serovar Enteritidis]EAR0279997.1 hypothetical protein [Salmonella enterica]